MVMLVDSHCHLDMLDLNSHEGKIENIIENAREQGVCHMLCVCVNMAGFPDVLHLAKNFVDVTASVGVHPNEQHGHDPSIEELVSFADNDLVVAIGETGLDYYRTEGDVTWQRDRFRRHLRAAKEINKPVIIHTRNAREDTLKIMREEQAHLCGGVMHCFTEDWEMAQAAIDMGFYISFSGIVTFNSAKSLQTVAKKVPLESMLIETDAPYLAPIPFRGKQNEPAFVRHVADFIATLRDTELEIIAQQTTQNFFKLFGCKK